MYTNKLSSLDKENFIHPLTHLAKFERGEIPARIMKSASGMRIRDSAGIEYIDAFSGLYCVNVGYGCTEIIDAIKKQAENLAYYHAYYGNSTEASIELSNMVINLAPKNMSKIYFGLTGSDANETNIKLLWHYNNLIGKSEKKKIISRNGSYHGAGIITGSLTGIKNYHKNFGLPLSNFLHTEEANYFHRNNLDQTEEEFSNYCSEKLEEIILIEGPETIAGFIAEPVMGNGGLVPPPKGYWNNIDKVLKKYNISFIADEVITGFGRLGEMFGCNYYDIKADLITVAKGITSAYAPLSGSIISNEIYDVIRDGTDKNGVFTHGSTYSAHPISCAAALANLNYIDKNDMIKKGSEIAKYFNQKLKETFIDHPNVGDIRYEGLLSAIELVKDKQNRTFYDNQGVLAQEIVSKMAVNGILARAMPSGDTIGFAPAFCLSKKDADTIIDSTSKSISEVINH